MKTLVIAEAGVNHNGDLGIAKELVKAASICGADLIKFQSFVTGESIARNAPKAEYQLASTSSTESQFEMIKRLELSKADHEELIKECQKHNIGFFSTAFDFQSYDMLFDLGMRYVKIPSGELTNLPLLRYLTQHHKPIFLSTGMATLAEIEWAIEVIVGGGTPRELITILHCTTEYPSPMHEVNLKAMLTLGTAFGLNYGYSDHTEGIEIAVAAVALGASVIEKHFTLDRNMAGPDHRASLEPHQLKAMISSIRNIEAALGNGIKQPTTSEQKNRLVARKSIVARRQILAGERFSEENLAVKRPGTGVSPMRWDEVIGKIARRDFSPDEMIDV